LQGELCGEVVKLKYGSEEAGKSRSRSTTTFRKNQVVVIALPFGFYYNEYQSSLSGFIANLYGGRR
jgi:hypothetical protein